MTAPPALLFLAAGLGSRYGGAKQLEPVGPGGETLMDYGVYDAVQAGFGEIIFVTRPELEPEFHATILPRIKQWLPARVVTQRLHDLPSEIPPQSDRRKPWGTGQAVLAARELITGGFGVLNADDLYGRPALELLARFLTATPAADEEAWAVVGFPLRRTLSPAGPVNRALCRAGTDGWLDDLVEVRQILSIPGTDPIGMAGGESITLAADDLVSMNLWGFTPRLFEILADGFRQFLESGPSLTDEYFLPEAVSDSIRAGRARVRLLETDSPWCGLSHPADRPAVEAFIRGLIADGVYPERLPR